MLERFEDIFGLSLPDLRRLGWQWQHAVVNNARRHFDRIADELIDPRDLMQGESEFLTALGCCYARYLRMLWERNLVDFAHLQVWTDELLQDDRIARGISVCVRHLMCDEYRDTSHVQEQVLLRLAEAHGNLCVVGDDDQSLYRSRGASVENILHFPTHLPDSHTVALIINYRSHPAIVRFYDEWMATAADWPNPGGGPPFRHSKMIRPHDPDTHGDYPAVIAVAGNGPADEGRQIGELLRFLKRHEVTAEYGQAALLLRCVPSGGSRRRPGPSPGGDRHHHPPAQGTGVGRGDHWVAGF